MQCCALLDRQRGRAVLAVPRGLDRPEQAVRRGLPRAVQGGGPLPGQPSAQPGAGTGREVGMIVGKALPSLGLWLGHFEPCILQPGETITRSYSFIFLLPEVHAESYVLKLFSLIGNNLMY